MFRSLLARVASLFIAGLPWVLPADVIFDNSVNDLHSRFNPGTLEVGDEIVLAGTARYLTNFSFEFWGTNTLNPANLSFAGVVQARVRFYLNNGPPFHGYGTPGTNFYDSGWFSVPKPTSRNLFVFEAGSDFPAGGLYIPASNITWSVQFQGMAANDSVGVDLFSPPVVGIDFSDYWENDISGWTLKTNSLVTAVDFAAVFQAIGTSAPLPSLQITSSGGQIVLSWPLSASDYVLESATNLSTPAFWTPQSNGIAISGSNFVLTNFPTLPAAFYRLHQY